MPVDTARLRELLKHRDEARAVVRVDINRKANSVDAVLALDAANRTLDAEAGDALPALLDELEGLRARVAKPEQPRVVDADARLAEIEAREQAATRGPWAARPVEFDDWGCVRAAPNERGEQWPVALVRAGHFVGSEKENEHRAQVTDPYQHNRDFIAHAREDVPWLVAQVRERDDELESLKAERGRLRGLLYSVWRHWQTLGEDDDAWGESDYQAITEEGAGWLEEEEAKSRAGVPAIRLACDCGASDHASCTARVEQRDVSFCCCVAGEPEPSDA